MPSPDDKYLIPPPPAAEVRQPAQHKSDQTLAWVAIGVAAIAAIFTGIQAGLAYQARNEARQTAQVQAADVERSSRASESSALAANLSAGAAWAAIPKFEEMAMAQRNQTASAEKLFRIDHTPSVVNDVSYEAMFKNSRPKLQPGQPIKAVLVVRVVSGSADDCVLKLGTFFASSTHVDLKAHFTTFPAVMGLAPGTAFELPVTSELPDSSLKSQTGTIRFYAHYSIACGKTLLGKKAFSTSSCFSFPVSTNGDILDEVSGCKVPNSDKL